MAADFMDEQGVRANYGGNFRLGHIPTAGGVKALESGAGNDEHGVRRSLPFKMIPTSKIGGGQNRSAAEIAQLTASKYLGNARATGGPGILPGAKLGQRRFQYHRMHANPQPIPKALTCGGRSQKVFGEGACGPPSPALVRLEVVGDFLAVDGWQGVHPLLGGSGIVGRPMNCCHSGGSALRWASNPSAAPATWPKFSTISHKPSGFSIRRRSSPAKSTVSRWPMSSDSAAFRAAGGRVSSAAVNNPLANRKRVPS